ncbi:MAG: transport permease protein [Herpetosiphonaceae bacterium]|nr:MAG: transport permease protein [Herpetosiphonaceae bacterium]
MKLLREIWIIFIHSLRVALRNPMTIIVGLLQPVTWLLLFAPLLKNLPATAAFSPEEAINIFTPGMLVMLAPITSLFSGIGLVVELRNGVLDRLRVTPVSRLAVVLGKALRDLVVLLLQGVLLVAVAWTMGLRIHLAGILVGLGLMMIVGLLMISCSYAFALILRNENAVASIANVLLLPLLLLSGLILPLELAPRWMQIAADFNPLAYTVEAMRALFTGRFDDTVILNGFLLTTALAVFSLFWATRSFRRALA